MLQNQDKRLRLTFNAVSTRLLSDNHSGSPLKKVSLLVTEKVHPDMDSEHLRKFFFFKGERKRCTSP